MIILKIYSRWLVTVSLMCKIPSVIIYCISAYLLKSQTSSSRYKCVCVCVDSKHIIDIISLNVPNHQHILTVTSVSQNNSRLFIPGFGSNGTIYISTNMTSYILRNVIPFTPHSPCGLKQKGPVRNIVEPCCRKSVCYRTLVQLS